MRRKLTLNKETLTELTTTDLSGVVGAASGHNTLCLECINDFSFEVCPTPTLPLEQCPITVTTTAETTA